jgi:nicotinamidase-related amidase
MKYRWTGICVLGVVALGLAADHQASRAADEFTVPLRGRVQPFKGVAEWQPVRLEHSFGKATSAIVICDMWDKHWCSGATSRVGLLAQRMDPVLRKAREAGILIIHAPSDTMDFYKDFPQRKAILQAPEAQPPAALDLKDPPLPIDDSDGGCDTPGDKQYKAWSKENSLLSIGPNDFISDNGSEIYNLLRQNGIRTLFLMGVHTNMCVLTRTFAIRQMSRWGIQCVLVRDLTDAMYNPADRPFVTHAQGTDLVIEHIEKYWCPTLLSQDFTAALVSAASKR